MLECFGQFDRIKLFLVSREIEHNINVIEIKGTVGQCYHFITDLAFQEIFLHNKILIFLSK